MLRWLKTVVVSDEEKAPVATGPAMTLQVRDRDKVMEPTR